jgi:uncharacterized repeat protein (TIGR01451 family)
VKRFIIIGVCLARVLVFNAHGFSTDGSSLTRSFDRTVALTNTTITVTVTFTNGGAEDLRGFVYSEEIPSGMNVTPLNVSLNGQVLTNFVVELGQDGDVYAFNTPCRWILERPAQFGESNSIPVGAAVQIVYALSSAISGSFGLEQFSWAACHPASTNAEFGYSESGQGQMLSVVETGIATLTSVQYTESGFTFLLSSLPGLTYRIETSRNLFDWSAMTTNTAPFVFTDTNAVSSTRSFYRAIPLP